ncbi:MAG TPA: hypothetical protein GXZ90_10660 [Clostridiales bacterium]|jgi:hypothetical protein|nr:hypothetical protein [Clostridiales bacterium]
MTNSIDYQALASKLLEQETSEEMLKIRQLIMLRTAMEGDVSMSRVPAPINITEVGGYYNLLAKQKEHTMLRQLVSSALGLPNDYAPDLTETVIKDLLQGILNKNN